MRQLPNIITFSRIIVLIILVWLVLQTWTGAASWAFFCILYGSISDFLDGYIARKYNYITNFGKIMDALVDKVMTLGAFVLLLWMGLIPPFWVMIWVVLAMAAREIGITLMRVVAARRNVVLAAEKAGKRKTIWQVTAICVLFAVPMFEKDWQQWFGWDLTMWINFVWINGYLYFALAAWLTISSGVTYVGKYAPLIWGKGAKSNVE
ncbi:MAG: CDP-diacylglycerol--glycerol-3-phosphate 3-phosphatidyltransferase [Puniceicoccaceae bacterium]